MSSTLELFERAIPEVLAPVRPVQCAGDRVGIVAMSDERQTNAIIHVYDWLHRRWPDFIDWRPIDVVGAFRAVHFHVSTAQTTAIWGLPVIAAVRIKASVESQEGLTA